MMTLIIAVGLVLIASALCSGIEASLFSVSMVKVKQMAEQGLRGSAALLNIRNNMNRPIAAIVVLNNIANIVGSVAVGGVAAEVLGNQWIGLFSGMLTFLVIIFSEIIPKTLGEKYSDSISLIVAPAVAWVAWVLTPILWILERITLPITGKGETGFSTNEAEIKLLASLGSQEGVIAKGESDLIQRTFELNNTKAKSIMTPRVAMTYIDGAQKLENVKNTIITSEHSRILITENTPDNILGLVLKSELLRALLEGQGENTISSYAQPVRFVNETITAEVLLSTFQKSNQHLAVVQDEFGGVAGIVTLEDVIEILTGEIVDETDLTTDLRTTIHK